MALRTTAVGKWQVFLYFKMNFSPPPSNHGCVCFLMSVCAHGCVHVCVCVRVRVWYLFSVCGLSVCLAFMCTCIPSVSVSSMTVLSVCSLSAACLCCLSVACLCCLSAACMWCLSEDCVLSVCIVCLYCLSAARLCCLSLPYTTSSPVCIKWKVLSLKYEI